MIKPLLKPYDFVMADESQKSAIAEIVRISRRHHLSYLQFVNVVQLARKELRLSRPPRQRKLPQLLTEVELKQFYRTIRECGNTEHELMLRLLLFTALRVSELVNIERSDVDRDASKISIREGKGKKDRYVLFPESLRMTLATYLEAHPKNRYLFESSRNDRYTPRRIQQLVEEYQEKAGIVKHVHPHLLRHQMITFLTAQGLEDSQIQLISGHESKKSLEIYQHLSLEAVDRPYQSAVQVLEASLNGR